MKLCERSRLVSTPAHDILEAPIHRIQGGKVEPVQSRFDLEYATLVHLRDHRLFEITIPGKTQSCLSAGKPILASVRGDAADPVRAAGAGVVAAPGRPDDLARATRELYAMAKQEREAMGASGRAYFEANLTHGVLLDRYEELFASVAGTGRRAA